MKEMKRTYHKQRKWVCPVCGLVRMQRTEGKAGGRNRRREAKNHGLP